MSFGREGESIGSSTNRDGIDALAVVNGVDANGVGIEIADPEGGIVGADDGADRMGADEIRAAHLVGTGGDFRDGVAIEVGDEDFSAVRLQRQMDRCLAHVEKCEQAVGVFALNGAAWARKAHGHDLMSGRAGYEGLRRVGQNSGICSARASGEGAARFIRTGIHDCDAAADAIGDNQSVSVRSAACHAGSLACADGGDFAARFQINHGNIVLSRVGDVGALAVGVHVNEIRFVVNGNGGDDGVFLSINHADGIAAGVDGIHFVASRIGGDTCWVGPDLEYAVLAEIDQIKNGDSVTSAAGDVGVLAVIGRELRKVVWTAGGEGGCQYQKKGEGKGFSTLLRKGSCFSRTMNIACLFETWGTRRVRGSGFVRGRNFLRYHFYFAATVSVWWMPRGTLRCRTAAICDASSISCAN